MGFRFVEDDAATEPAARPRFSFVDDESATDVSAPVGGETGSAYEGQDLSNPEKVGARLANMQAGATFGLGEAAARAGQREPTLLNFSADVADKIDLESPDQLAVTGLPSAVVRTLNDYIGGMVAKGWVDIADMFTDGDVRESMIQANEVVRAEAKKALGSPELQYTGNDIQRFGWEAAEATANMAPALVVGWMSRNPGLSLGVISGQVYGNSYNDYMDKTGDHEMATAAARFNVAAEIIPETIPVTAILKKGVAGEGIKRLLEASLGEGAQEMVTEVLQSGYDDVVLEGMSLREAFANIDWDRVKHAGLLGTVVGTTLATPGMAADALAAPKFDQTDQPPELFTPTHKAGGGADVQAVTRGGKPVLDTYITQDGKVIRDSNAVKVERPVEEFDISAYAGEVKAELGIVESIMPAFNSEIPDPYGLDGGAALPTGLEEIDVEAPIPGAEVDFEGELEQIDITDQFDAGPFDNYAKADISRIRQKRKDDLYIVENDDGKFSLTNKKGPGTAAQVLRDREKQPGLIRNQMKTAPAEEIKAAATEAATSPENDLVEPTEAQKKAGNYRKGKVRTNGLDITIENPEGSERSGVDPNGEEWSVTMPAHYGYIRGTVGADSEAGAKPHEIEQVDVYIGKDSESQAAFLINQQDPDTLEFDEVKTIIHAQDLKSAMDIYFGGFSDGSGPARVRSVYQTDINSFREMVNNGAGREEITGREGAAQAVEPSVIQNLAQHTGQDAQPQQPVLPQLRGQGDKGSPGTDAVQRIPGSDGGATVAAAPSRQDQQRPELRPRESALGDQERAGSQPAQEQAIDSGRSDQGARGMGRDVQPGAVDDTLPALDRDDAQASRDDTAEPRKEAPNLVAGKKTTARIISTDQDIDVQLAVVDAGDLITSHSLDGTANKAYPQELQPRDRSKGSSKLQVQKMANSLKPELLEDNGKANGGAPIIGPDGVVESGNGRTMAILQAYQQNKATGYREHLIKNAASYGLTEAQINGMKNPVLVRVRQGDMDPNHRAEFARQANQSGTAPMTPIENAIADAKRITDEEMQIYAPSDQGNILAASNQPFLEAFGKRLGDLAVGGLSTPDGRWTKQMADRVQAAVFYRAYGDEKLLALVAEEADPDIKNILSALNMAAPSFARARAVQKDLGELDIISDMTAAIDLIRKAKAEGTSVKQIVDQAGLFGDVDPVVGKIAEFLQASARSPKRMGIGFSEMAKFLEGELRNLNQDNLFELAPASKADIVAAANKRITEVYGDDSKIIEDLFSSTGEDRQTNSERTDQFGDSSGEQLGLERADTQDSIAEPSRKKYATEDERVAAKRAAKRKHREKNKEAIATYQREWREKNKGYMARWRETNEGYDAKWREENKESIAASQRKWKKENKAAISAAGAKYYAENKDAHSEAMAEWRKANPASKAAINARYRASKASATPAWADLDEILKLYVEAQAMTELTGIPHSVDHIIPLQGKKVTGLHTAGNLQVIPAVENSRKNNKFDVDQDGADGLLARKTDPYDHLVGTDFTYDVKVESTGEVYAVTIDASELMTSMDTRIEALRELRSCVG